MVHLGLGIAVPIAVEIDPGAVAEVAEAGHVPDRCVQPDIEIFAFGIRDLETEVGRVARDVPVVEPGLEPLVELVCDLGLHVPGLVPVLEYLFEVTELEEQVLGIPFNRGCTRDDRDRVLEFGSGIGRATYLAIVAVLILGTAFGAGALDETVGQEHLGLGVVGLGDGPTGDMAGVAVALVDGGGADAVFFRVGRVVIVETNGEAGEVLGVFGPDLGNQFLRIDPFGAGAQHDRCAVRVVGADVIALVATHLLEAAPDVGLDVLDQVTEVDRAVGIGQGAGNQDFALLEGHRNRRIGW